MVALGFVGPRIREAAVISIVTLPAIIALRQHSVGVDGTETAAAGILAAAPVAKGFYTEALARFPVANA